VEKGKGEKRESEAGEGKVFSISPDAL